MSIVTTPSLNVHCNNTVPSPSSGQLPLHFLTVIPQRLINTPMCVHPTKGRGTGKDPARAMKTYGGSGGVAYFIFTSKEKNPRFAISTNLVGSQGRSGCRFPCLEQNPGSLVSTPARIRRLFCWRIKSYDAPRYAIFYVLRSVLPSKIQTYQSAPCSQVSLLYGHRGIFYFIQTAGRIAVPSTSIWQVVRQHTDRQEN
jgi:hypothetical protein